MQNFYGFLILLVILTVIVYLIKDKINIFFERVDKYPFAKNDSLMNVSERKFFDELKRLVPEGYVVFPQIVLSSIIHFNGSRNEFWKYQNKINRKTIDYVIFELPDYKPVLGIEYDGKTHDRPDRMERDYQVSEMLKSADIPSFHVRHEENINFEIIKTKLNELLPNRSL